MPSPAEDEAARAAAHREQEKRRAAFRKHLEVAVRGDEARRQSLEAATRALRGLR